MKVEFNDGMLILEPETLQEGARLENVFPCGEHAKRPRNTEGKEEHEVVGDAYGSGITRCGTWASDLTLFVPVKEA